MRIKYFNRYELKYLVSLREVEDFVKILPQYLEPDPEGDKYGRYTITSLYYDTNDYRAYWDKIEGHKYRRKVRIRTYGNNLVKPETLCFVEIKQRLNKTLQKKRIYIPYSAAEELCGEGVEPDGHLEFSDFDKDTLNEVLYLQATLQLQPACVVSYDRMAFEGSEYDAGLRITLDTNLKGRIHDLTLLSTGYAQNHYFIPPTWCVLEIKVNYRIPYWLTQMIAKYGFSLRRISKYCAALEQSKSLLQTQRITY